MSEASSVSSIDAKLLPEDSVGNGYWVFSHFGHDDTSPCDSKKGGTHKEHNEESSLFSTESKQNSEWFHGKPNNIIDNVNGVWRLHLFGAP